MDTLTTLAPILVILATIINLYFAYRNYRFARKTDVLKKPVLDIKLEDLPPYGDHHQKTELRLKNVGSAKTGINLLVVVSCSWMPGISYKMNFPTDTYNLEPNEEISWKFRIDDKYTPNSFVAVKVVDGLFSWEAHDQIS